MKHEQGDATVYFLGSLAMVASWMIVLGAAASLFSGCRAARGSDWPAPGTAFEHPAPRYDLRSIRPHLSAVVEIRTRDRDGNHSRGTGTVVARDGRRGTIVTAAHVVRDCDPNDVTIVYHRLQVESPARVLSADELNDIAVLATDDLPDGAACAPLADRRPELADTLFWCGYARGPQLSGSPGRLTKFLARQPAGAENQFQIEPCGSQQGDSGGPLFNERGELAGVLFAGGSRGQQATTATICCYGGPLQNLFAQCGPFGCPQPQRPAAQARPRRLAAPQQQQPPRQQPPRQQPATFATAPAAPQADAIDHSQFALKSDLQKLAQQQADAHRLAQGAHSKADDLKAAMQQHLGGVAGQLADAQKAIAEFDKLAATPAGQQATSAAGVAVEQIEGASAAALVKIAFAAGGPTAAIAAALGFVVLRKFKRLAPLENAVTKLGSTVAGLKKQSGSGGAAPRRPFCDAGASRARPTADTDDNGG